MSASRDDVQRQLAHAARHFEISHDMICTMTFGGRMDRVNPAFTKALGWDAADLRDMALVGLVHPDEVEPLVSVMQGMLTTGEGEGTNRMRTKDGGWRWIEWVAVLDRELKRVFAAGRDISDRIEAERALQRERRQLAEAQRTASVGSWRWDFGSDLVEWSEQNFRNHGLEPATEAPSMSDFLATVHPDDRDAVVAHVRESAERPRDFVASYRVVHPDGSVHELELRGAVEVGGGALGGTSRDVTAEREAERLKDDFFNLISHELRTPLTSIIGYTELLAEVEGDGLSEDGRKYLEVIERNSRRELDLVGDLLMLTRIEAGTFRVDLGEADLERIVAEAVTDATPSAERAGVELQLELVPTPTIDGDAHRLGQVIANLVSNAVKFTPDGGDVRVSVGPGETGTVHLEVADTGIGIPESEQRLLFDRMYRAREAERRQIQGTGLGLTIVKAIVDAHGGAIRVSSREGEGATFTVELPVRAGDVVAPSPALAAGEAGA